MKASVTQRERNKDRYREDVTTRKGKKERGKEEGEEEQWNVQ